jgi:hypothetical protein
MAEVELVRCQRRECTVLLAEWQVGEDQAEREGAVVVEVLRSTSAARRWVRDGMAQCLKRVAMV